MTEESGPKSSRVCFNTNTHSIWEDSSFPYSKKKWDNKCDTGLRKKAIDSIVRPSRGRRRLAFFLFSFVFMKFAFYSTIFLLISLANKYLSMVRSARLIRSADNIIFALTARIVAPGYILCISIVLLFFIFCSTVITLRLVYHFLPSASSPVPITMDISPPKT